LAHSVYTTGVYLPLSWNPMAKLAASGKLQQQLRNSSSVDAQLLLQQLLLVLEQSPLCNKVTDTETSDIPSPRHPCDGHGMQRTMNTPPSELSSSEHSEYGQGNAVPAEIMQHCGSNSVEGKHKNTCLSAGSAHSCSYSRSQEPWGYSSQSMHQLRVDYLGMRGWYVSWPVAVHRLQTTDKQIVSPAFEVAGAVFRLMLKPREMATGRGKSGFRHARGRGHVELKCVGGSDVTLADLHLSLTIKGKRLGPISHNFASTPVVCLPREEWNFAGAVDNSSTNQIFTVHLHLVPSM